METVSKRAFKMQGHEVVTLAGKRDGATYDHFRSQAVAVVGDGTDASETMVFDDAMIVASFLRACTSMGIRPTTPPPVDRRPFQNRAYILSTEDSGKLMQEQPEQFDAIAEQATVYAGTGNDGEILLVMPNPASTAALLGLCASVQPPVVPKVAPKLGQNPERVTS